MKKYLKLSILSALLLVISCGEKQQSLEEIINSDDVKAMRKKRTELSTQQRELNAKLEKLNTKIESFETSSGYALVEVAPVNSTLFKHYVEVQGDVQTDQNILIYPEFSGVLEKIYVKEGDEVSKGQLLAKIDDGGLGVQLQELKTQLSLTKTRFERQSRLWEQNIGSEIQYLEAKTAYNALLENVKRLKKQLDKTELRAPFAGKIDQKLTDQGQVVNPGMSPVFRLINLDEMYIYAEVPEQYLSAMQVNTSVKVELQAISKSFDAKIEQVSDFINPANRKFSVKIDVPSTIKFVKPNLVAQIKINDYSNKDAIVIDASILQETASGKQIIYTYQPDTETSGVAKQTELKIGRSFEGYTEVLEGLSKDQYIITSGARSVRDEEKLKIKTPIK